MEQKIISNLKETYLQGNRRLAARLEENYRKMRHTRDVIFFALGGLSYLIVLPIIGAYMR